MDGLPSSSPISEGEVSRVDHVRPKRLAILGEKSLRSEYIRLGEVFPVIETAPCTNNE
jgi:hypothetical protein